MSAETCAIVLAAGRGSRMGQDKALLDLGGVTAIERVAAACAAGGVDTVVIVRSTGAAALPDPVTASCPVAEVAAGAEMIDSLRCGLAARPEAAARLLVFPVDHALVGGKVVAAVLAAVREPGAGVALPLWEDRPGHPIGLAAELEPEILDPGCNALRDVVVARPERVRAVAVDSPWVRQDLDTPDDLARARAWLAGGGRPE